MKLLMQVIGLCIVLLGSLAIPVYQHTCLHDNVVVSSAFVKTTHCQEDEKENGHGKPCCNEEQKNKKCCDDEVNSLQIPFFQVQNDVEPNVLVAVLPESIDKIVETENTVTENQETILSFTDLPPPKLPKRLALLQVWRI